MKVQKLRHWRHADAAWFRDLDRRCFPTDEAMENGPNYHWWIISDGQGWVVGFAGLYVDDADVAHFCRAGVVPERRGMGFHLEMIEKRIVWCRRRRLGRIETYAHPGNLVSIANLKVYGFKGREVKANGKKWLRLWRDLP